MSSSGAELKKKNRTNSKGRSSTKSKRVTEGTRLTTTTPTMGKRIRVYRNGDPFHKGINVVLNMRHSHDINSFLDAISEKIGLTSGVKRLYTLNGSQIKSTNALENNKEYVASSGGFMPLNYGEAYKQHQTAFMSKKEESGLSLSSKKSLPTRMSRSSTELKSTSRDLSVRSFNSPHSTKNNTSTLSTTNSSHQSNKPTATRRSKSLVARGTVTDQKPISRHINKEENEHSKRLKKEEESQKKKRVKKSPVPATQTTKEEHRQNGKAKEPAKLKATKKKETSKKPDIVVAETKNDDVVQPGNTEHRPPSHEFHSAIHPNRPPSRRDSRASVAGRRPETAESRKSTARHESGEHSTHEHSNDDEPRHVRRESEHKNDYSEYNESRSESRRSAHSRHENDVNDEHERNESDENDRVDSPQNDGTHSPDEEREDSPSVAATNSEDDEEDRKPEYRKPPKNNVPLEAL